MAWVSPVMWAETATMAGLPLAAIASASLWTSDVVTIAAAPPAPGTALGSMKIRSVPRPRIWSVTPFWVPWPTANQGDHRADADHETEQGERAAQPVADDGADRDAEGVERAHVWITSISSQPAAASPDSAPGTLAGPGLAESSMMCPSRMRMLR